MRYHDSPTHTETCVHLVGLALKTQNRETWITTDTDILWLHSLLRVPLLHYIFTQKIAVWCNIMLCCMLYTFLAVGGNVSASLFMLHFKEKQTIYMSICTQKKIDIIYLIHSANSYTYNSIFFPIVAHHSPSQCPVNNSAHSALLVNTTDPCSHVSVLLGHHAACQCFWSVSDFQCRRRVKIRSGH